MNTWNTQHQIYIQACPEWIHIKWHNSKKFTQDSTYTAEYWILFQSSPSGRTNFRECNIRRMIPSRLKPTILHTYVRFPCPTNWEVARVPAALQRRSVLDQAELTAFWKLELIIRTDRYLRCGRNPTGNSRQGVSRNHLREAVSPSLLWRHCERK